MTTREQLENGRAVERLDRKIKYKRDSVIMQWIGFTIVVSVVLGSVLYSL